MLYGSVIGSLRRKWDEVCQEEEEEFESPLQNESIIDQDPSNPPKSDVT
jgi:hypothetical protein